MTLPIKRARLELDRALRSRPFVARAVGGRLALGEYHDLLLQLGQLLTSVCGSSARALLDVQREDVKRLATRPPAPVRASPAVELLDAVLRERPGWASPDESASLLLCLLGTSWTIDASERLARRYPGSTALLLRIGLVGQFQLRQLAIPPGRRERLCALAEILRGGLLALATDLDLTWPAPVHVFGPATPRSSSTRKAVQ